MAHRYVIGKQGTRYILTNEENRELAEFLELAKLAGNTSVQKLDDWIALFNGDEGNGDYEV